MNQIPVGTLIETTSGSKVKILQFIGAGGQGQVYMVEYKGEKKALKWYRPGCFGKYEDDFYNNLLNNARKGSPDPAFLWPVEVTKKQNGSFGYIMELVPENYHEFQEFLLANVFFSSFKSAAETCIRVVSAFRILHNNGYCYQDMNCRNFLIDPDTGEVRICDCDNIAPNGTKTFILGTPRFMAPEVVIGKTLPSTQTDRYSLAVILFMLLFVNHPLEGEKWLRNPCLTSANELELYGKKPLFIYDPENASNRPSPICHKAAIERWNCMPNYIKQAFIKAFSQEALHEPAHRMRELDWLKILIRFQNDIVICPKCGNEVFITNLSGTVCDKCSEQLHFDNYIHVQDYAIPAERGVRLYRCQMGICNADNALEPGLLIVSKGYDTKILGLRNESGIDLIAFTPSGRKKIVKPGEIIPVRKGILIQMYGGTIEIG